MPLEHWLQLSLTAGLGPILQTRLIESCGSAESACNITQSKLRSIEGIGASKSQKIFDALKESARSVEEELSKARDQNVTLICRDDAEYPALLKLIPDPPAVLYVKGNLEPRDLHSVAIVGSRRCSFYGREQAERFGALLAGAGITVVSGGARGIDSAAHRGAISHTQGRTLAVLGSGIDVPYPSENANLFEQIATRGAVISEYALGTPPLAENFPRRNRIVSGLSRGVLVIEADVRSGALITARQACDDHERPVMALPGRVDNAMSAGPHKLIRDGANLVTSLEEIIDSLGPLPHEVSQAGLFDASIENAGDRMPDPEGTPAGAPKVSLESVMLTEQQQQIVSKMGNDSLDLDTLIEPHSICRHI